MAGSLVQRGRGLLGRSLTALAVVVALGAALPDPVDDLRQALPLDDVQNPSEAMLQFRRENLQKKVDALQTVGQLRRALALDEWRDDPSRVPDIKIRVIDAELRRAVGERLTKFLEQAARSGDPTTRLAVANLIAEIGPSVRALTPDDKSGFARSLTPQVVLLAADKDVGVRQEALRALGNINAKPEEATRVFVQVLDKDPAVGPRRIAANSLGQLMRVSTHLQKPGRTQAPVFATRPEMIHALQTVVLAVPSALRDADAQVRYLGLDALSAAAQAISDILPDAYEKKKFPPAGRPLSDIEKRDVALKYEDARQGIDDLRPVLAALNSLAGPLAKAAADSEPRVRQEAGQALLHSAWARQRLQRWALSLPNVPGIGDPQQLLGGADPLETFFAKHITALMPLLRDSDARTRKSAGYVVLLAEDRATPLADELIAALSDPERSVRWAAAKTLGFLPPAKVAPAAAALAKLLSDEDVQLRITVAQTLESLGPAAHAALPALAQAVVQADPDTRIAVLQALLAQGTDQAKVAVPQLTQVLQQADADTKVLIAVCQTLARIGRPAQPAIPALRRLFGHEDAEVRTSASEAILAVNAGDPR